MTTEAMTSKAILQMLGERLKQYRIEYPLTQKQLADKSGVSLRCIQRFEKGEDIQTANLVKLLGALELADHVDLLIPDVTNRPSLLLENAKRRQRVRIRKDKSDAPKTGGRFIWGDEK